MRAGFFAVTVFASTIMAVASAQGQSAPPVAWHGYVSLGSAATYRGLLRSASGLHWQAGLELAVGEHAFAAVHVSDARYTTFFGDKTDGQSVDYALGWRTRLGQDAGLELRVRHNTFPKLADALDYAYTELDATFVWGERWQAQLAYYDNGPSVIGNGAAAEVVWRAPWRGNRVSAALGAARYRKPVRQSYAYWDVGLSRVVGPVAIDVRYHYTPRTRVYAGRLPARGEWVLSATAGF